MDQPSRAGRRSEQYASPALSNAAQLVPDPRGIGLGYPCGRGSMVDDKQTSLSMCLKTIARREVVEEESAKFRRMGGREEGNCIV